MSEDIGGGLYLITCGLSANAFHDELGRGGYFHPNSGTSEGQLIMIYGFYRSFELLKDSGVTAEIDAADYYRRMAEMMLDAMGDGSLDGPMLRQPVPEDDNVITLVHWLFAAKGDVELQGIILDYQAVSAGGVLTIPNSAHGGRVYRVWQIYPAASVLLYDSPFSPVVGGGGILLAEDDYEVGNTSTAITLPAGVPDGAYKIVYGYDGAGVIPRGDAYEAYPAWTAIPDGYAACAPDTFRWFEQSMEMALRYDRRAGAVDKWTRLRNAMRRTALRGQDISDLREVFKPQPRLPVFNVDGMYCYANRPDSRPPPLPLDQNWTGYSYWQRDDSTGDVVGYIPGSSGGEAQLGRGFEDGWRTQTSYQDADQFFYVEIGVDASPLPNESLQVYVSATREYSADQRWYCRLASLPGFAADGVVRGYLIPRTSLRNNFGSGDPLPAGTTLLNFGLSTTIARSHTIRLRRMRFLSGTSEQWVRDNQAQAVLGAKMPYFPGAMPFAINADTVAQQFVGYNGNPFHGYQLPDFWLACSDAAIEEFPSLSPLELPIPAANGALTFPIKSTTTEGVLKPRHFLLAEQQVRFLVDARAKYTADTGIFGPFAHTYVLNTPARANIGNPAPHTWVYTNDDPNTRWVGYQVRVVESLARLVFETMNLPAAKDLHDQSKALAADWLVWLNGAWPSLNSPSFKGMPTDFPGGVAPQTLYEETHAPAIVIRACLYLRLADPSGPNDAVYAALIDRCWAYLERFWRTQGTMRYTWSTDATLRTWYGFWHGEIVTALALMLDHFTLLPPTVMPALVRRRLVQTTEWLMLTGTFFCGAENRPPALPVFDHKPNWDSGMTESFSWLTDVLTSTSGAEQRRALRTSPRRTLEANFLLLGAKRAQFDLGIRAAGGGEWLLPVWPDGQVLRQVARENSFRIIADTQWRDFYDSGSVLLVNGDTVEAFRVNYVDASSVMLSLPLTRSWPVGTKLYPLRPARLTDQPAVTVRSKSVATAQVRFQITEANDWALGGYGTGWGQDFGYGWGRRAVGDVYKGYPVLAQQPDESQDLTNTFERMLKTVDNDTGIPTVVDEAGKAFGLQGYRWQLRGPTQHARFRDLLYSLQGRRTPLWLPTFAEDFLVIAPVSTTDNVLTVRKCGYTAFGGPNLPGRQQLRIKLRGAAAPIYRQVVTSIEASDTVEQIVLDLPLGVAFNPDDVSMVSFMALSRMASDTIDILHETATDGIAKVGVNFRNTYEERVAPPIIIVRPF